LRSLSQKLDATGYGGENVRFAKYFQRCAKQRLQLEQTPGSLPHALWFGDMADMAVFASVMNAAIYIFVPAANGTGFSPRVYCHKATPCGTVRTDKIEMRNLKLNLHTDVVLLWPNRTHFCRLFPKMGPQQSAT